MRKRSYSDSETRHAFQIEFVSVGEVLERQKRDFLDAEDRSTGHTQKNDERQPAGSDHAHFRMHFDDVLYRKQWYLVGSYLTRADSSTCKPRRITGN